MLSGGGGELAKGCAGQGGKYRTGVHGGLGLAGRYGDPVTYTYPPGWRVWRTHHIRPVPRPLVEATHTAGEGVGLIGARGYRGCWHAQELSSCSESWGLTAAAAIPRRRSVGE